MAEIYIQLFIPENMAWKNDELILTLIENLIIDLMYELIKLFFCKRSAAHCINLAETGYVRSILPVETVVVVIVAELVHSSVYFSCESNGEFQRAKKNELYWQVSKDNCLWRSPKRYRWLR